MHHESLNDVLIDCVKACGGSKVVGLALWPAKGLEAAQRNLLACLNADRPEKLSPDEVLLIARMAREKGCHLYAEWVAFDLGYTQPEPLAVEDQVAELQREYIEAARAMAKIADRIERTTQPAATLRAAA